MTRRKRSALFFFALVASFAVGEAAANVAIEVEGVDGELRRNVLTFLSLERYKNRDDLDAALMERLQERTEREAASALRPFGYYEPKITTEINPAGTNNWRARIRIEPGRAIVMDSVTVQVTGPGAGTAAFAQITSNLPLRPGDRLNHAAYDSIRGDLTRTAATLGYLDARLTQGELRVDPPNYRASAVLELDTGVRYLFGPTTIEQKVINETLVRRFLRYQENQPYDATELLRTQFALDDTQYFSSVEVVSGEADRDTHIVPVSIRAEPVRKSRYSFGFGYGTDTQVRGTATWENRRVNPLGHRFRLEVKGAAVQQSVSAIYTIPIGDPALEKLAGDFSYLRNDPGDLETRTTQFQPSITQISGRWQRVLFTNFTRTTTITPASDLTPKITSVDTLPIPGISYASVPQGYLGEALFTRALYAEVRGSARAVGSPANYLQLRVQAERVFDLVPKWHLFLRGQVGATLLASANDLPGTERFFAGGDRSVRGFGYNDLSPTDAGGSKVGGRNYVTATFEVIRDLPRNLGIAVFSDAGNAFNRFGDPLQYSVGVGIRLRLPVVTIGIDVAQPLTDPKCRSPTPDERCGVVPGFDSPTGPRLHLNFSPKL